MIIRYTIKLTKAEVEELRAVINKGSHTQTTKPYLIKTIVPRLCS